MVVVDCLCKGADSEDGNEGGGSSLGSSLGSAPVEGREGSRK